MERVSIIREPDDELAESRVSLGRAPGGGFYIVFRGDPDKVLGLMRDAISVATVALPQGKYNDKRNRPQG